jgi:Transient receptor potential (TRP) ion channel/ML-like domain
MYEVTLTSFIVPSGSFAAQGALPIPQKYIDMIPSIAFSIPDLDGMAKLTLSSKDGGQELACLTSSVSNGKTADVPAVSYITAGVAAAALALTGVSAIGAAGSGAGAHPANPGFGTVMNWFGGIAMNGMMSVQYPPVYQSFTKNFAWSAGLIPWGQMQTDIDNFRAKTGGNITTNSYAYLKNATLIYTAGTSASNSSGAATKRDLSAADLKNQAWLTVRDLSTNINGTELTHGSSSNSSSSITNNHFVHGIESYAEQLLIPNTNTFMTVLLIFAVIVAAIAVGILLLKVILESWALFGSFPQKLTGFRKRYWGIMARTIVNLILVLYGVWVLYCVYQFTNGDSWAAKVLAGVTLGIFTGVLAFFSFKIWQIARRYKKAEGDTTALFENKETWRKYSLFYDQYKKDTWWIFLPAIIYMLVKGCIIAGGDGHGLRQTAGQLIVEALMLLILLWHRPYVTTAGNVINIIIQVVRVLSVVCVLVFVEELGISTTGKTITGVVLIVVQSVMTGLLAILIAVNAIIVCCRENPHRKKRKAAQLNSREFDNLTPLDARNSLLMDHKRDFSTSSTLNESMSHTRDPSYPFPASSGLKHVPTGYREESPPRWRNERSSLMGSAGDMGVRHERSLSRDSRLEPTVPQIGLNGEFRPVRI